MFLTRVLAGAYLYCIAIVIHKQHPLGDILSLLELELELELVVPSSTQSTFTEYLLCVTYLSH